MAEPDTFAHGQQSIGGVDRGELDPETITGVAQEQRIANRLGRSDDQETPGVRRERHHLSYPLLTAVLALGRSFQIELENGALEGLRLYPGDRRSIGIGKIVSNVLTLAAMEILVVPIGAILYNLDLWPKLPALSGVLFLATIGLAAVGTFYAALTANLRAREVMLPLLLFPVMVPVVLGAVKATNLIINGTLMTDELGLWIRLLIVFDVIFVTVCILTFEYVIEE